MRIAVFSDTHGRIDGAVRAIRAEAPDMVFHLGDCARDAEALRREFPQIDLRSVRGNCDIGGDAPDRLFFEVEGVPVLLTHGHLYSVKYTLDSLKNAAGFLGARLALFGHTHCTHWEEDGGVAFLNPGSAGTGRSPTYAMVEIQNRVPLCKICPIPEE